MQGEGWKTYLSGSSNWGARQEVLSKTYKVFERLCVHLLSLNIPSDG